MRTIACIQTSMTGHLVNLFSLPKHPHKKPEFKNQWQCWILNREAPRELLNCIFWILAPGFDYNTYNSFFFLTQKKKKISRTSRNCILFTGVSRSATALKGRQWTDFSMHVKLANQVTLTISALAHAHQFPHSLFGHWADTSNDMKNPSLSSTRLRGINRIFHGP